MLEKITLQEILSGLQQKSLYFASIYLCGPTVYDDIHLGNLRSIIIFDFLIRYLRHKKIFYKFVLNITDIDDKIIKKAQETGLQEEEISEKYKNNFLMVLKNMNVILPTDLPQVTENIHWIISTIQSVIDKGFAYEKDGDVLFDITKVNNYYEISNQKPEFLNSSCQEEQNFALWKKTHIGKTWDSPWGKGRPGWHVECFSFIQHIFNDTIHIHGGGVDLKFPHHENENALSHAIFNRSLADLWIHVGHVQMNNEKISKSSNRGFIVKDLLEQYSNNVLRYIFLKTHYSKPCEINQEILNSMAVEWECFEKTIHSVKSLLILDDIEFKERFVQLSPEFFGYIEDDLDLPNVLMWLEERRNDLWKSVNEQNIEKTSENLNILISHLLFLGFQFKKIYTNENKEKLHIWKKLKIEKKYKEADELRDELKKIGIL